jgi:hypothetical protein
VATGHVDDDVPNSLQLEVLDQEICILQSADVWHVLAVVLYPTLVNSLWRAVSMCSCAPDVAPACCV